MKLLAASTGLRRGEIRGLRVEDLDGDYVSISRSYGKFGPGPTKTKWLRRIPITGRVADHLRQIAPSNGYLFSVNGGASPVHSNRIASFFIKALSRSGVPEEQRRDRRISFHSWRHFFYSLCRRKGIPDTLLRRWTGHSSEQMTEHYTHFLEADFAPLKEAQAGLFPAVAV